MKTQMKSRPNLTKKQILARRRRRAQVRRQKLALLSIPFVVVLIAVVFFFLRKQPEEKRAINAACEAYRTEIQQIAAQYGMSDYVDLILALMMQESSGKGPDVLQSSEGAYNEKYPQVPNGITDVSYSIACGIQELKYSMDLAQVQSPVDLENIKLALQGYNFGADSYFSFMEERGLDSWSEKSAEAFAKMASGGTKRAEDDPFREHAGPWAYGDQRYPEHVLRYYHPEGLSDESNEN